MWRATIKGLLAHKLRLGLTALAIVLGVGMVSGTYILTDTLNHAFDNLFSEVNRGVAVAVSAEAKFKAVGPGGQNAGSARRIPDTLLPAVRAVPGVRVAEGVVQGYAQLVGKDGKAIQTGGAPTLGFSWSSDAALNPLELREGSPPRGPGEIVIDAGTAKDHGFHVGDAATVLLQGPPLHARVVGIVGFGSNDNLLGATLVSMDLAEAQRAFDSVGTFDAIEVAADEGVSPAVLRQRIQAVLPHGVQAKTGTQSAAESSNDIKDQLKFFNVLLLVFAGVALFVGAFLIFNTFSILVAQRTRELALLRALGATPGQVRRSVMAEGLVVGLAASLVGLGLGFVLAIGLHAAFSLFGLKLPTTTLQFLPRTVVVSVLVGVLTTWISSIMPAFRASRVPPVAAMRETGPAEYAHSRRRTIVGGLLTAAGVALLLVGLFGGGGISTVGLGVGGVFWGVSVLSPIFVRPVAGAIGAPVERLAGVSGKLGRENTLRNPRRTAATASALMIGLALVGFVGVFAASIKSSTDQILEETLRADYIVSTSQGEGFSQGVADRLRGDPVFGTVAEFRQGVFGLEGATQFLTAVDPAALPTVTRVTMVSGSLDALQAGDMLVSKGEADTRGLEVGDRVHARFASSGARTFRVGGIFDTNQLLGRFVVSLAVHDANYTQHLDTFVLATRAPGVGPLVAEPALKAAKKEFPNVRLEDQAQFRKSSADQVNQLLGLIFVLLGLALIIAFVGIVNTLALSVFERTREIGLLRAVGMSRRQVRTMVRWEGVMIVVYGALIGLLIGVFFGWAMTRALRDQGIVAFSIPVGQLVVYLVVAAVFGVLAALWPAWRASRLDVLRAVTVE
jgi:putative ABC transport system permease protein